MKYIQDYWKDPIARDNSAATIQAIINIPTATMNAFIHPMRQIVFRATNHAIPPKNAEMRVFSQRELAIQYTINPTTDVNRASFMLLLFRNIDVTT